MMLRTIKCKNQEGAEITFTESGFNPFVLAKANGIYDVTNNVYMQDNTLLDGSTYIGSVMAKRNIVLYLKDIDNYAANRELLDNVFRRGLIGVLTVQDEDHEREIEYFVESLAVTMKKNCRLTQVSLLCPDPHFYDPNGINFRIMDIQPQLEFPHEFVEEGEEFSYVNTDMIATINNTSGDNDIGLTISITATGTVTNPSVTKIETNETLALSGFSLSAGDTLVFTTTTGKKNVCLISGNTTTDVNQYLTDASVFFQLTSGVNHFGVDASSGKSYMRTTISCRYKYMRA